MAKSVKLKEADTFIDTEGIRDFEQGKTQAVINDELIKKHEFHSSGKTLVGTYDGKPLYRQTVEFSVNKGGQDINISTIVKSLDAIVDMRGILRQSGGGNLLNVPYYLNATDFCVPFFSKDLSGSIRAGTEYGDGILSLTFYFTES